MSNLLGLGAAAFAMLGAACASSDLSTSLPGTPISISRLRSEPYSFSHYSGFQNPARLVVRDAEQWEAVWAQTFKNVFPVPPRPAIDFSQDMVVVVALGVRSSGGYGILIDGASEIGTDEVAIAVRSISPAARCVVTAAFTQPVDIARMPRHDRPVRFVERNEVHYCT